MNATLATPADLDIVARTVKGNEYRVVVYVDPFPGRKGSDRVVEECGACRGSGIYDAPSGLVFFTATVGTTDKGCFQCDGTGRRSRLVSTARATARAIARNRTAANAEQADYVADAPAREEAERLAAWDEALEEQARRDAKAKGHLGTEGERLRKLAATVVLIRSYEAVGYYGNPETKYLVKFDVDGKVAVWFTGWHGGLEEGQAVSLTGTVKSHGDRDGEEQTILTRCLVK